MYRVRTEAIISAAHRIEGHEKCSNLHGHNFRVVVQVSSEKLDENRMVVDFLALKRVLNEFDHTFLNEKLGEKRVTSELLAEAIYKKIVDELGVFPDFIRVYEGERSYAEFFESE